MDPLTTICVRHRRHLAGCASDIDPVVDACERADLPLAEAMKILAEARRDRLAEAADDTTEWSDPDTGRRYLRVVRTATIAVLAPNKISCTVVPTPVFGYVAGDILDLDVPGQDTAVLTAGDRPNVAVLTWGEQ